MRAVFMLVAMLMVFPVIAMCGDVDSGMGKTAGLIAGDINSNGIKLVGVTEFTNESGELGGNVGVAGKYFSEKFEEYLIKKRQGYKIIERMKLDAVLKEGRIQASGITDQATSKNIVGKISGLDGLILGSIIRMGMKASVSCKLIKLPDAEAVSKESFLVDLDADLASLFGIPVVASSGVEITSVDINNQSSSKSAIANIPKCPYKLEVISGGSAKQVYTDGKDFYIEASNEEEYSVRIMNSSEDPVAAVLLIDGINSIYEDGKPVRDVPSECRPWIVYPSSQGEFMQNGWQISSDKIRKFVFSSDLSQSVAKKMGYTNELGMITAVIYKQEKLETRNYVEEKSVDFGTKEGSEETAKIQIVDFKYRKNPVAILTLRYCGKDKIAGMRKL